MRESFADGAPATTERRRRECKALPMASDGVDLVTGAFGNTGAAIAALLAERGRRVRTLTNHPPSTDDHGIEVLPLQFDAPDALAAAFDGVSVFYNTFWMRTGDRSGAYETAVARSKALITAAERAGVERIVHLSVAHPAIDSPYPYFRAKAQVEQFLAQSTVPSAIARPALVFGGDQVLLNNLAWILRRAPAFGLAGDGRYRVRPIHVDDLAHLCLDLAERPEPATLDAVGPDRPTYEELVVTVRDAVGSRARLVHLPPRVVLAASSALGAVLRDRILTAGELRSTMDGLADSDALATGSASINEWIHRHARDLGRRYLNEQRRR
jgi:NADH dehydrogenase